MAVEQTAMQFDAFYTALANSGSLKAIFRHHLGWDLAPEDFAPYSFVTPADLNTIQQRLALSSSELLVDVGCGNASLSLLLAERLAARLIGVDLSQSALAVAAQSAKKAGLEEHCCFKQGTFDAVPVESGAADAIVSIDAVWMAHNQHDAFAEMARVLHPGGRLVFTSWEQYIPMPFVTDPVSDYRLFLERAGFEVLAYEYLSHSETIMKRIYSSVRREAATLISEMGGAVEGFIGEAHFVPGLVDGIDYISPENGPHVLVTAVRLS